MTPKRFQEHFTSGPETFLVLPHGHKDDEPYRGDGKPLTGQDRAQLAGEDPIEVAESVPAEK